MALGRSHCRRSCRERARSLGAGVVVIGRSGSGYIEPHRLQQAYSARHCASSRSIGVQPAMDRRAAVGDGFQQPSTRMRLVRCTFCSGRRRGPSRWPVNQSSPPQSKMGITHPKYRMRSCRAVTPRILFPKRLSATRALCALFAIRAACSVQSSLGSNQSPNHRRGRDGLTTKSFPGPRALQRAIGVLHMRPDWVDRVKCIHSVLEESRESPRLLRCVARRSYDCSRHATLAKTEGLDVTSRWSSTYALIAASSGPRHVSADDAKSSARIGEHGDPCGIP